MKTQANFKNFNVKAEQNNSANDQNLTTLLQHVLLMDLMLMK